MEEFNATCVGVAATQFNDRLQAVADGQGSVVVRTDDDDARAVQLNDARPFLFSGLDVDAEALDGLVNGAVTNLAQDIAQAGGYLNSATLAAALEAMFASGILHERERVRREVAGDAA
jgi:hypothetical protein